MQTKLLVSNWNKTPIRSKTPVHEELHLEDTLGKGTQIFVIHLEKSDKSTLDKDKAREEKAQSEDQRQNTPKTITSPPTGTTWGGTVTQLRLCETVHRDS